MADKKKLPPIIQGFGAENVLRLLGSLKDTANGTVVYRHVSHAVREMERAQNKICLGYATLLLNMIKSIRQQLPADSLLSLELQMIQLRLTPPVTITELAAIQVYLSKTVDLLNKLADPDEAQWLTMLRPLIDVFDETELGDELARPASPTPSGPGTSRNSPHDITRGYSNLDASAGLHMDELESRADIKLPQGIASGENVRQEEFTEQQSNLMSSIFDAMQHQARFGLLLEDMLQKLQKAENKKDVQDVRGHAINELQQMLSEQSTLVRTLNETQNFANLIQESGQQLSMELNQVRILSMTDELTELPNRRAFLNRLNEEMQRAKRYKSTFSVALIDLDEFKKINDTYGHMAGDEMLCRYAKDILTIFRASDLVARYGGEEFAVIFPNTTVTEALSALEKAQALAFTVSITHGEETIRAPSFSAGLVTYTKDETPEEMIDRADQLLYKAKHNGRHRIEYQAETTKKDKFSFLREKES